MKILKHKNIMGIIYGILLLMPFLSIFARTCYVIANKNAYQSYNGTIQYQQNVAVEKPTDLLQDRTYNIEVISNSSSQTQNASYRIGFSSFTLKDYLVENGQTTYNSATYFTIGGAVGYTNNSCFGWYDSNMNYLGRTELPLNNDIVNNLSFVFTNVNTTSTAYFSDSFKDLIRVKNNIIVYDSTLSNVFEYSVSQFIEDNNFGKVNLFNWFTDLFLDNNAYNNMYVHYINWYLNYSMLVSCMHLLFLVLMWFVNYSKRLLDRGMNYDW